MAIYCPHCSYPNPDNKTTCFKCNSSISLPKITTNHNTLPTVINNTTPTIQANDQPQWVKPSGKFDFVAGCFGGLVGASWLFFIGIIFCCTGFLVIPGVILFISAILMVILSPFIGVGLGASNSNLRGECPHCGLLIDVPVSSVNQGWVDCCGCKERILIINSQFVKPNKPYQSS